MSNILVTIPYLPFPTRANGITVRIAPVLEQLAKSRQIHLLVAGEQFDLDGEGAIRARELCTTVSRLEPAKHRWGVRFDLLNSMRISPVPPRELLYSLTRKAVREATSIIERYGCDSLLTVGDSLAHYAIALRKQAPNIHSVIDWIDSPSLHLYRASADEGLLRQDRVEALKEWERKVNSLINRGIYVSATDAEFANCTNNERVVAIPNGLVNDFPKGREHRWRSSLTDLPKLTVGYLGNMGYLPNHLAALRLCTEYLPFIIKALPQLDIRVKIIGRSPRAELLQLANDRIRVTGSVPSIWDEMEEVDVFLFPLTRGAGMQNKVLEAMRSKRPVIVSRICAAGIPDVKESGILCADTAEEAGTLIGNLVSDHSRVQQLSNRGLSYAMARDLDSMIEKYIGQLS